METDIYYFKKVWNKPLDSSLNSSSTLVFVFGASDITKVSSALEELSLCFSNSIIMGSSTAGEIYGDTLLEGSLVVSVMKFHSTKLKLIAQEISSPQDSFNIGQNIVTSL